MSAEIDIEAVSHTFDNVSASTDAASTHIRIPLKPYTGDDAACFVEAQVHFVVDAAYPESRPRFILENVKGMSDRRVASLHARLSDEAEALQGEMLLMSLCMAAREELTTVNYPEGPCSP
jgi:RWD domain